MSYGGQVQGQVRAPPPGLWSKFIFQYDEKFTPELIRSNIIFKFNLNFKIKIIFNLVKF